MTIQIDDAIAELKQTADVAKAGKMNVHHKVNRDYWGVGNAALEETAKGWRQSLELDDRLQLATDLWNTNVHEARIAAAKLLTQARIRPDDSGAWELIKSWTPEVDGEAICDAVCDAGQRRLAWNSARLDDVEGWTNSTHVWTRRAALVITAPWTKQRDVKPAEAEQRERILGWIDSYIGDEDPIIMKAMSTWLRELSRKDPARVSEFLETRADKMKPFYRKDAMRHLPKVTVAPQSPLEDQ